MDKQEQTKAKTAEEIIRSKKISLHNDDENGICYVEMRFIDCVSSIIEYSAPLQSHIANLEQQVSDLETALIITNNSRKAHIERYANLDVEKAHLEAQNKELTDKYAILVQDYSSKFYEQAKEIKELREALTKIKTADDDGEPYFVISEIAEQALKEGSV